MLSLSGKSDGTSLYRDVGAWVGKADGTPESYREIEGVGLNFKLIPIAIDNEVDQNYYGGFCNDLIWPLFHYFPSLVVFRESYFESYLAANRIFAEKIAGIAEEGDFIWIHDYHLFLVPQLLRNAKPGIGIGFFLHIPFPPYEIFRTMPKRWSEKILDGILGADLIGFHTFDYCQYFLRAISRIKGHEIGSNMVFIGGPCDPRRCLSSGHRL